MKCVIQNKKWGHDSWSSNKFVFSFTFKFCRFPFFLGTEYTKGCPTTAITFGSSLESSADIPQMSSINTAHKVFISLLAKHLGWLLKSPSFTWQLTSLIWYKSKVSTNSSSHSYRWTTDNINGKKVLYHCGKQYLTSSEHFILSLPNKLKGWQW